MDRDEGFGRIVIEVSYQSVDDVPAEFRPMVERAIGSGEAHELPAFDRMSKHFAVDGVTHHSLDEVPERWRGAIEEALRDENEDGVPDALEGTPLARPDMELKTEGHFKIEGARSAPVSPTPLSGEFS